MNKLKIILTGATGMVGEGVLHECLSSELVESILVVNRKPCGYENRKLSELIVPDFMSIEAYSEKLKGYDTCLFCLGVSSVGMDEKTYTQLTYDLTLKFARTVLAVNNDMCFSYISGAGTDSSEKGRLMWARVKGKTENHLKSLRFKKTYNFRPGMLKPSKGLKNTLPYYKYLGWIYPILKLLAPNSGCKLSELGQAMIKCSYNKLEIETLEVSDIIRVSKL